MSKATSSIQFSIDLIAISFHNCSAKIFLLVFIINLFYNSFANSNEIYVVSKVNNKIITNTDVNKEFRYLVALNPNLKNMDKIIVMKLAKDSIIKEKIKEDELNKYYDLNVENKFII